MAVATALTYRMLIDGAWRDGSTGRTFAVRNPATGETIAEVPDGGLDDVRAAVEAAHRAFPAWSHLPAEGRAAILHKAATLMRERLEELARVLTMENGKPISESRGEVATSAAFLDWNAEEARRAYGQVVPAAAPDKRVLVLRQPVGVVAAITPWNFPLSMPARKVAPALAAGCTVVLRPSRATPLVAIETFRILKEAGIPAGVANIVTGTNSAEAGRELAEHPLVRKLTFTGSTEVGKQLMRYAAGTMKRVSFELGGHAPFIVFDDADLEKAAQAVILSRFRNAGQTCICTNRLFVQEGIAEQFSARVAELARNLKVGNGLEAGVQVGPLIDERGFQKVEEHVEDALSHGAKVLAGGHRLTPDGLHGYFYEPTVLGSVRPEMLVMHDETFGPVLPVMPFAGEDDAIRLANDTPFGLAAYFFTRDMGRGFRVAEGLEYGIVGLNDPLPTGPHIPFGGFKESGIGRENGAEGLQHFMEVKALSIGL
ncbi:MAG: NAD-dependent succinate-semialdehyde dehydrogenase [Chloroflexota bacterium]